jgi:hypothetical protein
MKNEGYIGKQGETEVLGADEQKISDLLGGLKRVDAPANFEFRLKSRIANTRPEDLRPRLIPVLGYAAPLVLVLIVGTYLVVTGVYTVDQNSVADVEQAQPVADLTESTLPNPAPVAENEQPAPNNELQAASREETTVGNTERISDTPKVPKKVSRSDDDPGGSFDTGLGSPKVILPKSLSPNEPARISIREILSTIGVQAAFDGGSIKVSSVVENNRAGRSGIEAGDILETINGRPVTGATMFDSPFTATSVGVRRGGKSIQITLR